MKVVFQLPKWTDRYSHVSFSSDGSWPATAGFGSRVDFVLLVSGHSPFALRTSFLRCPFGIELRLVCALHISGSREYAALQCAHREHAPNDVEGNVPVRLSSEDRSTPVRGQAV